MGYSRQQIAARIGVYIRQYPRIECGERDIRYASMKPGLSICAVLRIDPLVQVSGGEFKRMDRADEAKFEDATGRTLLESCLYFAAAIELLSMTSVKCNEIQESSPRLHDFQELELVKNEANELKRVEHAETDENIQE